MSDITVPELLSIPAAAEILQVNAATALQWVKDGRFPVATIVVGARHKVRKDELLAYVRGQVSA